MDWVLRSPQIHSTFGNLGFVQADGYHVNENCNAALETILHNILTEDKYLRTYRRSISFGQNIKKDLIPLLIHAKDDKTIELLVRVLMNLTIPIECLLSVDIISKSDFGRHTVFEINNLLVTTKIAFTDPRPTRVIIDFLKKKMDTDQNARLLSLEQCTNISNLLLLLRNILHIPEENNGQGPNNNGQSHGIQNQIIWNIFSQGIDKVLIKLMIIPDVTNWGVTMVQLISLLYKDQHVSTLQKLLNLWLEASLSESSEDNESNTSPPDRGSGDSSPMLTSDQTSDSSDTAGNGKINNEPSVNAANDSCNDSSVANTIENHNESFKQPFATVKKPVALKNDNSTLNDNKNINSSKIKDAVIPMSNDSQYDQSEKGSEGSSNRIDKKIVKSENSDCGYGTQIENQESISTSSNEDELPMKKPVHQKPHNPKQRVNCKGRSGITIPEKKRKKIVKRVKSHVINVQGLLHKTPSDDDISNHLKEFTVNFLLRGYNSLVQTLHNKILANSELEIDTSHFFWLVTYFLKFATQIELDFEHVSSVLSFNIVTYLTAEGVNLCEQFELAIKLDGNDLKPSTRRLHLVVTAIREFVQAIEVFKKFTHISKNDKNALINLQIKMCETDELRSLLVLLLRHYNPKYHTKQYLQDLIVTNHILLLFIDNVMKLPAYNGTTNMVDHIRQFATTDVMYQYGLLLEGYTANGEYVNDCIFTMMHHVGGELASLKTLFQPKIIKSFTSICESEFEICDDWSDLIQYVINTFIKKPRRFQSAANFRFDDEKVFVKPLPPGAANRNDNVETNGKKKAAGATSRPSKDKWTDEELSSLSWKFMQCNVLPDSIGELVEMFKEDGIIKTRDSIIRELFRQNLICNDEFDKLIKKENEINNRSIPMNKEMRDDEISKLCEQLAQGGKLKYLEWVQKVLLDTCYAKMYVEKMSKSSRKGCDISKLDFLLQNVKKTYDELPVISPVSYHSLLFNQSVPLVPWNCEQASICKDLKFLQLLHRLGFHMPVDSGRVFIRIPQFWTAKYLYEVASKILIVDTSKLKFRLSDLVNSSTAASVQQNHFIWTKEVTKDATFIETSENVYQIHRQKHVAAMVNFTPMPGTSYNPEGGELNKPNWYELVQKSQEYKITLKLETSSSRVGEYSHSDVVMQPPPPSAYPPRAATPPPPTRILSPFEMMMPALSATMSVKIETSNYSLHHAESEYTNSVCETESVASDLTRMYVSDEDEKSDILICPVKSVPIIDDHDHDQDQEDQHLGSHSDATSLAKNQESILHLLYKCE